MISIFSDIRSLIKLGNISIDNWVFKLHYKLTTIILLTFAIVVTSRQYFGDPIDCTKQQTEISNYIDTYCWFNSYSLVDNEGNVFFQVRKWRRKNPYSNKYSDDTSKYRPVKQTFYQWIGFVLLLQSAFFYLPRMLWKVMEEGRIKELVAGLQTHVQDEDELIKRQEKIIEYVKTHKGHHLFYSMKFFLCEVLNFFNVIAQIFVTDWFLGHAFLHYGLHWLWYDLEGDEDSIFHPSYRYFPKETICDVYYGSPGEGAPNFYQARCILPIHIFNEKIYIFLWFYFFLLAFISGGMLIYRILVILLPNFRYYLFLRRAWATDERILKTVVHDMDIGDWFIMYQMMKNMDPFVFGRMMTNVYDKALRTQPSIIADESRDQLLGVFSSESNYDIQDHKK